MLELDQDNLEQVVADNPKVIVQYGAGWCGNCRMIRPKFKNLAAENPEVTFVYADAEKFPGTRKLAKIENLPTFAGFVQGKLVTQNFGNKIEIVEEMLNEIANH